MKTRTRWSCWVGLLALLLLPLGQAVAATPTIQGHITGFELAAQGDGHGAIFVFSFVGTLNTRFTKGTGWIEIFHDPLPTPTNDYVAKINSGEGALWIGLFCFDITVLKGGTLILDDDDPGYPNVFDVTVPLNFSNRFLGSTNATFGGSLSHLTFPPTIWGSIGP